MAVATAFQQRITSAEELRELLGEPSETVQKKQLDRLDEHCRAFIAHAPFLLLGTSNGSGECDVSPKGDAPGFVRTLDDRTLVIPDRPGNRRIDTLSNILENPRVGLLFLIPNVQETLRVNGQASIIRDEALLEEMTARGKRPLLAIAVEVEEAFIHCPKAFIRSSLWDAARIDRPRPIATLARIIVDHTRIDGLTEADQQRRIDASLTTQL
jgi:PPOX class probable FMN-dependent enzyme